MNSVVVFDAFILIEMIIGVAALVIIGFMLLFSLFGYWKMNKTDKNDTTD